MTGLAAVDRTLARVARAEPSLAARAAAAVEPVARAVAASAWPEVATAFSRLTATGYPIEFAWSSRDASLRWTAEVAGPELPEAQRLSRAATALRDADAAALAACQRHQRLRWGAWYAMRHGASGDATKVYAELGDARAPGWPAAPPRLTWRMAGVHPDGVYELYARGEDLDRALLHQLERRLLGSDGALAAAACAFAANEDLPRPGGLSITYDLRGTVAAMTWFVVAKALFRDDGATAAALRTASRDSAALPLYAALSGGAADGRWRHGMVGVGLDRAGALWFQAGLRPT